MTRRSDTGCVFSVDPEDARADRRKEASLVTKAALAGASDAVLATVAANLGVSVSLLKNYRNPEHPAMIPLADVAGLPPVARRHITSWLAELDDCAIVELPEAADVDSDLHLVAAAQKECGEAVSAMLHAVADRFMSGGAGGDTEREINEAIAMLLAMRERARDAKKHGPIGMTREPAKVAPLTAGRKSA